jgi:hypothetical protein
MRVEGSALSRAKLAALFLRAMRSLELFLLHPFPDSAERARFPALRRFLSRSRTSAAHESLEGVLLEQFGVARQRDWPIAPLARLGDGESPDDSYWIAADPVHLRADRDALLLVDASRFQLDSEDARTLVEALNRHFGPAELYFSAPNPTRWYARVAQAADIEAIPLREAAGCNVDQLLPRGKDALAWHRIFNEVQMLLHNHPLNEAREARGELPVNSVWFWGGGTLPRSVQGRWAHVWANDALSRGLALAAGIDVSDLPRSLAACIEAAQDGAQLAVLDQVDFDALETNWIAPALQAVRAQVLGEVSLWTQLGSELRRFDLARSDMWKFWRDWARAAA